MGHPSSLFDSTPINCLVERTVIFTKSWKKWLQKAYESCCRLAGKSAVGEDMCAFTISTVSKPGSICFQTGLDTYSCLFSVKNQSQASEQKKGLVFFFFLPEVAQLLII